MATGEPALAPGVAAEVPAIYKRIYGASAIAVQDGYVVIQTTGVPDHGSPYFAGSAFADKTEADTDPGFRAAPGSKIVTSGWTFRIPMAPAENQFKEATRGGPIGVAVNGVAFFNQYSGEGNPLGDEKVSFDQNDGHPNPDGDYHYHVEPVTLTAKLGRDALLGFLLDGFPVYGPIEGGREITSADLDAYHGHVGATADWPDGTYHYHITAEAPYINGDGYFGSPGTVVGGARVATGGGQQGGGQMPPGGQQPPPNGQMPPPNGQVPPPNGQQPPPPPGGQQPPPPRT